jgi:hypothetical protein
LILISCSGREGVEQTSSKKAFASATTECNYAQQLNTTVIAIRCRNCTTVDSVKYIDHTAQSGPFNVIQFHQLE